MSGFLLPLVTLPYLARVLGAEEFGRVAVAQSMALVLSVLIEYGFSLSATRDAARYRHEPEKMASLVCRVHGAKIFLSVVALLAATASLKFVGGISGVAFATGAWIYALVIGISPIWYYQGIERVKLFSMLDITGKAISVILIILLVQAEDASWVLFLQAAGPAATAAVSIFGSTDLSNSRYLASPTSCRVCVKARQCLFSGLRSASIHWPTYLF